MPHMSPFSFFVEVEEKNLFDLEETKQNASKPFCSHVQYHWQLSPVLRNYSIVCVA